MINYFSLNFHMKCLRKMGSGKFCRQLLQTRFLSTVQDAAVKKLNGRVVLTLRLPSSQEKMHFTFEPRQTVKDLVNTISSQDQKISRIRLKCSDGVSYSDSCMLFDVFSSDFLIDINNEVYTVSKLFSDEGNPVASVSSYSTLDQSKLLDELTKTTDELLSLEKENRRLSQLAGRSSSRLLWLGLGFMGFQFGALVRLVWYDYSWDIIEPVSYFVTYTSVIAGYVYYLITRQQNNYDVMENRAYRTKFHKLVTKANFDLDRYWVLKRKADELRSFLQSPNDTRSPKL